MARELFQYYLTPALSSLYYVIVDPSVGFFWDHTLGTPAFVAYNSANWNNYAIAADDTLIPRHYFATFPPTIPVGKKVLAFFYNQVGGSRLPSDTNVRYTASSLVWDGFQLLEPSGIYDRGVLGQSGDGITSTFDANSLTQQAGSMKIGTDFTDQRIDILKSTGNSGMYAIVTSMTGTNNNIAHFTGGWLGGDPPAGNVIYEFTPVPAGSGGGSFPSTAPNNWIPAAAVQAGALASQTVASVVNPASITAPILAALPLTVPFASGAINGTPTLRQVTFSGSGFISATHAYQGRKFYIVSGPNSGYMSESCLDHTVVGSGNGAVHTLTFLADEDKLMTTGDVLILVGK